ncbi:hypothetical protein H0H81_001330, partial [Sphagnurus paluster]
SQHDDYKRGAFLEKANRFLKEKDPQIPGPGTYDIAPKKKVTKLNDPQSKLPPQSQSLVDRYTSLQRKVEDLERVHNEGKKAHQAEVERLKLEIARQQKSNAEHADKQEKQKKQLDTLDIRIQDLKKAAATNQAEIKDLRVKLRMADHERTQLAGRQSEAGDLRKSLQSLEAKRKEELRERDRRISELEKNLAAETKKKDAVEAKLQDLKGKGEEELHVSRAKIQKLEDTVASARTAAHQAQTTLLLHQANTAAQEVHLLSQLEQHRQLIGLVAEEYGCLVRSTIPTTSHTRLRHQHFTTQLQVVRLERKLSVCTDQLDQVTSMVRSANEQNLYLSQRVQELEDEIEFYRNASMQMGSVAIDELNSLFVDALRPIEAEQLVSEQEIQSLDTRTTELLSEFYRLACNNLLSDYVVIDSLLNHEKRVSQEQATSLSSTLASQEAITARLESVQQEKAALDEQLKAVIELSNSLKVSSDSLTRRAADAEKKEAECNARNEVALKKERDVVRRLTETVQKSRMVEDVLRAEINQLSTNLADAERYQEAYYSLSDEVGSLLARNQLAEDEAQKLSKLNAEILGHNNPAQRILYVDRIRRELAETKHKLAMLEREQDIAVAANEDLQHELEMYKSVMVPVDQKPRTGITRVARLPLFNPTTRTLNNNATNSQVASGYNNDSVDSMGKGYREPIQVIDSVSGDMTTDEIM